MKSKSITVALLASLILTAENATAGLIGTLERVSPNPSVFTPNTDFVTLNAPSSLAATGDATGTLFLVGTNGCADADFAGFVVGSIAVVTRGTCTFADKTLNAQEVGAVGILIVNVIDALGSGDGLTMLQPTNIPALLVDDDIGAQFTSRDLVHMTVVRVADVPAPTTLALLSLALAGLGWSRRKN